MINVILATLAVAFVGAAIATVVVFLVLYFNTKNEE